MPEQPLHTHQTPPSDGVADYVSDPPPHTTSLLSLDSFRSSVLISRRQMTIPFPRTNKRQTQSFSLNSDVTEALPLSPLINDIRIEAPLPKETAQIGKFHKILASEIQRTALEKRLITIVCPPGVRSNQDLARQEAL